MQLLNSKRIMLLLITLASIFAFCVTTSLAQEKANVKLKAFSSSQPSASQGENISNSIGMEFVYIEPGSFVMGSPSDELGSFTIEKQHQVTLTKGFYMQTTEVTQGQWKAVMGSNPSYFKNCGDDCPVEKVSWNIVQQFIRKLNQREGENLYRLPTEAEWEFAARAGSTTALANGDISKEGCDYDSNLDAIGWYCYNSAISYSDCYELRPKGGAKCSGAHRVAQKQSNAWGLYDMHGNVWEWCQDWYGDYPSISVTNPSGPLDGSGRVLRGGSWGSNAMDCRSANRYRTDPGGWSQFIGFRLLRNP